MRNSFTFYLTPEPVERLSIALVSHLHHATPHDKGPHHMHTHANADTHETLLTQFSPTLASLVGNGLEMTMEVALHKKVFHAWHRQVKGRIGEYGNF